ncbi:hypothetical protein [Corallococcus macrosporus]|uniref:Uncharacterized protein n=1 Tax=Myxococcus fulvus (strain ATCC BAA-855 / HW-1) TaxID=483219 RepID=F8CG47_MYXFH|nr:hypothetical protein [Corallococcus macrosporus]AEI67399.1 hypothetical protein LILAB_27560 [Corallococcus macrosporus]
MSEGFTPPPPEHRRLPARRLAWVGGAWLLLVGLALLVVRWGVRAYTPWAPARFPPALGVSEVADVNQRPFELEDAAPRLREAQRARLRGYGWVDRDAGVIHIPVEQALEQVLSTEEGARP